MLTFRGGKRRRRKRAMTMTMTMTIAMTMTMNDVSHGMKASVEVTLLSFVVNIINRAIFMLTAAVNLKPCDNALFRIVDTSGSTRYPAKKFGFMYSR